MVTTGARCTITVLRAVQAAIRGAIVVTSTVRLSREIAWQVSQAHRQRGENAWPAPAIFPFDALLQKLWREWLLTAADPAAPLLLNPHQERSLFEQAIAESERDKPLQIASTAQAARQAWRLAHAWRLPLSHPQFTTTDDGEAFSRWWRAYDARCRAENWLDSARLPEFLAGRLRDGSLARPPHIVLSGFDEITPQQRAFFDALPRVEYSSLSPAHDPTPASLQLRDAAEELEQAAHWARGLLSHEPETRIAVIVPDLAERRALADRIFREVLHPAPFSSGPRAYHLSRGLPLADYPVVAAALAGLDAALPRIRANRAGLLLRSPFFEGSLKERAEADARLRRDRRFELTRDELRALHPSLRGIRKPSSDPLRPSEWAVIFSDILLALGWPGDRTPSSDEYQTIGKWREVLSGLATLDLTLRAIGYEQALRELRRLTGTPFQPEDQRAPVQILDMDEAAGLTFDHLWVTGLHDEQFPPEPHPNPFLPLSLQKELGMPHAIAQLAADEANRKLRRLIASAPDVRLSWPAADGEKAMKPSPFLARVGAEDTVPVLTDRALHNWQPPAALDELHDETAPPLAAAIAQTGGAKLIRSIAECPFQAFALYRLNLRPLEDAGFGISPADKGTTVHKALDSLWAELRTRASLLALSEEQTRDLVRRHVESALSGATAFRDLEQERLERLLFEFLECERHRQPFTVTWHEEKRRVLLGGLTLDVRIDRLDELPSGRRVLIDYKTGQTRTDGWLGPRPREPQIPLYAVTSEGPFAAFAIARIRTGSVGFTGIQENDALGPARNMKKDCDTIAEQLAQWKSTLEALAAEFQSGDARVHPLPGACRFCGIKALCRIGDAAVSEEDDAAE
jgi:probable DNA repair protein